MTRPTRVGVQLWPGGAPDYRSWREAVLRAENIGVDVIFGYDHFHAPAFDARVGATPILSKVQPDISNYEGWTALASWGEITSRADIGLLVTGIGYRNPDLLADMARTVDHISGGRLVLGIGAGWFRRDFDEYGYEFGTAPDRLRELGEALPRIRSRLARLNPGPVGPLPIMIGGTGPKVTLRLTAEHASIWHGFGSPEEWGASNRILDEWCAKLGRDPSEIERSVTVRGDNFQRLDDYVAAGATFLVAGLDGPEFDL